MCRGRVFTEGRAPSTRSRREAPRSSREGAIPSLLPPTPLRHRRRLRRRCCPEALGCSTETRYIISARLDCAQQQKLFTARILAREPCTVYAPFSLLTLVSSSLRVTMAFCVPRGVVWVPLSMSPIPSSGSLSSCRTAFPRLSFCLRYSPGASFLT